MMQRYKTALGALFFLLLAQPAEAVCTGQFTGGTICNNAGTTTGIPSPTATPTLGIPGSVAGSIGLAGATSGKATIVVPAVAGTPTITLPATSGTLGFGNVVGPASSVANNIVVFSDTTGKILIDSGTPVSVLTNAITALTGDITATGPGAVTATLPTINPNTGSFGSSTSIPNFTVNGKGQILFVGTNVVIAPAGTLSGATLAANILNSSLTGVGTLTGGATGAGFTVNFTTSTLAGSVPIASGGTAGTSAATARANLGVVNIAGDTMTGPLILNADPAAALGAATKQYVDAIAGGVQAKTPVAAATTANITRSGEQTIDGILTSTSRVLVKNQTAPAENGIFVSGGGAWTRATDLDVWSEVVNAYVFVSAGTVNSSSGFIAQVIAGGTIDVTAMPWAQFSTSTSYTAGAGLTLSGTQFSVSAGGVTNAMLAGGITFAKLVGTDITTVGALVSGSLGTGFTPVAPAQGGTGLTSGTSGGVPYFSGATTIASSAALTANLPVIGGGAGVAPSVGTRSGNTTAFVTTTGTLTSGRCAQWDASGNIIQASAACSAGSVTSIVAGTGLTGGTITTTGTIALDLTRANTWSGDLITSAGAYFKNGRPWADVRAWGAVGDTVTDDAVAINNAVAAVTAFGAGIVNFPPGYYCTSTGINVTSGGITLQGNAAISNCGHDVAVITMSGQGDRIEALTIIHNFGVASTTPAVHLTNSCLVCFIGHTSIYGGKYNVLTEAGESFHEYNLITNAYGSAMFYNAPGAGTNIIRNRMDQDWPVSGGPSYGSLVINAWASGTIYATGAVVSIPTGFNIQATTGGTSGGVAPTIPAIGYGAAITDNTVTWQLLAPTTYYAVQAVDGGGLIVRFSDISGPYTASVALTGSPGVQQTILDTNAYQAITTNVLANNGAGLAVIGGQFVPNWGSGNAAITLGASFSGDVSITNALFVSSPSATDGIRLNGGRNTIISNNTFGGYGNAAVKVAANVSRFIVTSNAMGSSATWGANNRPVEVVAGTSDFYSIMNNITNGATNAILDNGTGTNKSVQLPSMQVNAGQLQGATWGSPPAIGNISRNSGAFDTLLLSSASTLSIAGAPTKVGLAANLSTTNGIAIQETGNNDGVNFMIFVNSANSQMGSITRTNSTTTAFATTSDKRLKADPQPIKLAGNIIDKLEMWDFAWRETGERAMGVFAQDAYNIFPDAIVKPRSESGTWGVDNSKFVPLILSDMQSIHRRLEALEARGR